jgi:hypothetical protein
MKKRAEQLEFTEIQSRKLSRSTQKMVRHDFEQVLTACARLASFSGGARMRSDGPIDDRQEELAIDDLVLFGIHARRLIENTTGKRRFSRIAVPLYRPKLAGREVAMWRIINTIVHYELIEIIRSEGHLRAALSPQVRTQPIAGWVIQSAHIAVDDTAVFGKQAYPD